LKDSKANKSADKQSLSEEISDFFRVTKKI